MALKTKIGKADYDALEESLKSHYVADGEGYKLDADYEDVTGLKNKRDELLGEITGLKKQFEGIDPDAARKAIAELEAARREKMTAEELHKEDLKKLRQELETANQRSRMLLEAEAERDLERALTKHLRAEKIEDASIILRAKHLKWEEEDGKPKWKTQSGEPVDFDTLIPSFQSSKADWFEAKTQTGGGASGSGNSAGSGKTMPKSQWDTLNHKEQAAFIKSGGTPVE